MTVKKKTPLKNAVVEDVEEIDDEQIDDDDLEEGSQELKTVLGIVWSDVEKMSSDAKATRLPHRFPSLISSLIFEAIQGPRPARDNIGLPIRKLHDFYGWMAKLGAGRGSCGGTLYRTTGFMKIRREERVGSNPRKKSEDPKKPVKNIHIEHTVPIAELVNALWYKSDFNNPSEMHKFLINHSVCTAFNMKEESWLRLEPKLGRRNDAFTAKGELDHDYPFKRYLPLSRFAKSQGHDFRIFNVVSGEKVNLEEYSFSEHQKTLADASRMITASDTSLYSIPN